MQYLNLEHEYDQIHKQTCKKNQPETSMQDYVKAAEELLYSKRTELQINRAEAASREQSKPHTEYDKVWQDCIAAEVKVEDDNIMPSDSWVQKQALRGPTSDAHDATQEAGPTSQNMTGDINEAA